MRHRLPDPMFSHFSRTPTCDRQTGRHTTIAYTMLAWHCAVKNGTLCCNSTVVSPNITFHYHWGPFHLREAPSQGVRGWSAPALVHMEDVFDPSLGRVWRSKLKVTRDKKWPISVVAKWLDGSRCTWFGGKPRPQVTLLDGVTAPP